MKRPGSSATAPKRAKKTGSRFLPCPSCGRSIPFHIINLHADSCKPKDDDDKTRREQTPSSHPNEAAGGTRTGSPPLKAESTSSRETLKRSQKKLDDILPNTRPLEKNRTGGDSAKEGREEESKAEEAEKSLSPSRIFPIFLRAQKTIHLVRHGHTEWRRGPPAPDGTPGEEVFDVPLSRTGVGAAQKLGQRLRNLCPEVVIVSPLTRALQTLTEALGKPPSVRTEVVALHAEHVSCAGDVGRSPKVLAAEFPWLSFEGIPETWWYSPAGAPNDPLSKDFKSRESRAHLRERVGRFRQMLSDRPECTIAVIGHSTFFMEFASWRRLAHCEIYTVHL